MEALAPSDLFQPVLRCIFAPHSCICPTLLHTCHDPGMLNFFFFLIFVYLFQRETARAGGAVEEQKRENLSRLHTELGAWPRAQSLDREILTWAETRNQTRNWLHHSRRPQAYLILRQVFNCLCTFAFALPSTWNALQPSCHSGYLLPSLWNVSPREFSSTP